MFASCGTRETELTKMAPRQSFEQCRNENVERLFPQFHLNARAGHFANTESEWPISTDKDRQIETNRSVQELREDVPILREATFQLAAAASLEAIFGAKLECSEVREAEIEVDEDNADVANSLKLNQLVDRGLKDAPHIGWSG